MNYQLEVNPASEITSDISDVMLLWTQLPDLPWLEIRDEITPWFPRMNKYGVMYLSRFDYDTIKDIKIDVEYAIRDRTKVNDLVVDPFCGSSIVGEIALLLKRRYFGCDISQIAIDKSESRLCRL